jgi:signal transduction histidine kinase
VGICLDSAGSDEPYPGGLDRPKGSEVTDATPARPTLHRGLKVLVGQLPHLVFFVLVGGTLTHLVLEGSATCVYMLVLSLLVALGYGAGLALWTRLGHRGRLIWLAGLVLVWLLLTALAPGLFAYAYGWCAVPLACLAMRMLEPRAAAGAVAVLTVLLVGVLLRVPTTAAPDLIAAPVAAAWATAGLYAVQRREGLARQLLLDELRATRGALARQQRAAGALAERARIARDLHDTLAQELAGNRMLLQAAQRDRQRDPDRAWQHVGLVADALGEHLAETRRIIDDLTPGVLAESDLATALRELCERAERDGAAARVAFRDDTASAPIPGQTAAVLLRVAQGALANVRDHAGAGAVAVVLSAWRGQVSLVVSDDGAGFTPGRPIIAAGHGFGLPALRERMRAHGGTLRIDSAPGRGTRVVATMRDGASAPSPELAGRAS